MATSKCGFCRSWARKTELKAPSPILLMSRNRSRPGYLGILEDEWPPAGCLDFLSAEDGVSVVVVVFAAVVVAAVFVAAGCSVDRAFSALTDDDLTPRWRAMDCSDDSGTAGWMCPWA